MSDLLRGLNPPQHAAVTLPPQHALILAGAGSGKTRVLTTRIGWLITTGQARPYEILAVTFTNKAAREMYARLSAMPLPLSSPLGRPFAPGGIWVGTFHGICNRLLRAHHRDAGLPQLFQILDSGDQLSAIKRLLKNLNVDDQKFPPRDLQHFINGQKEAGNRPSAVEAWDDFTRRRVELYQQYDNQCQREGVVDFAELLLRTYELLSRNEPIRAHYQGRFRHILVDEFQDTNRLQYQWLKLLAEEGACLFAVGDDDQSIYAFRGADVGNMRDFEREFRVGEVIRLEQNYRSHGNILDAANAIIKHNAARLGKNLWTDAGAGEPLRVFEAPTDGDEARWIVEEVKALTAESTLRSQIALLYRSNAQSRVLEHALFSAGIPYRVYGGLRFFERQEIKHALAYLRLIGNPDDDTAFSRVVNFPVRGIGARSLELLQDAAKAAGTSLHAAVPNLAGKAGASLGAFTALIERMRSGAEGLDLTEIVDSVLEASSLRTHYAASGKQEDQDRLANLDELLNAAANFVAEEDDASLANFLTHASLEAGEHQAEEGAEALQLMTVHAAKGLEFDVVFLSGLEEGLFPHENSIQEQQGLEEERRLMYVAVTRARKRLYLSLAQTRLLHGQTRYNLKSRFLDEIPEHLLKWLTSRVQRRAYAAEPAFGRRYFEPGATPTPPPVPRSTRQQEQATGGLRVGQNVQHAKFGTGVIVAAEGSGADARVQVKFGREGTKWLALAYAKLTPA
jgi:DNA helicase II / ATP-dependent DNA helicase PcrA